MAERKPVLAAQGLIKRFPGVVALKGVSFDLYPAEIHALCGENGAGKSTLIKTLSGIHVHGSYEGEILVDGQPVRFQSSKDANRAGVGVIYQELALVPEMTVAENVFLGSEPKRRGFIDWDTMLVQAKQLLDKFGLDIDPLATVESLGVGRRQLVEIAKALSKNTRLLILDEPTAALTEQEVDILLDILRDLRKRGIGMVYISHKLDEVFAIADRITILRDGQSIITLDADKTDKNEVIKYMVGREITDLFPRRTSTVSDALLKVRSLTVTATEKGPPVLDGITFEVRAGEVLGFGGLMGAGRTELLMHLFGAFGRRQAGTVLLNGQPLAEHHPPDSIRRGMVLVSEDRKRYGLILDKPIGFNLSLSNLWRLVRKFLVNKPAENARNKEMFDSLRVKAPSLSTPVGTLSGGNQQKVVLGKAMMIDPQVIFLDEPTRGIDVGAKLEVYELVNRMTAAGKAVVLVSSELPELMGMSDRIIMLNEGSIGGEFTKAEATQEKLLAAAMGQWRPASQEAA
jgi:D-xylose transport system ATP-binding protein